jgi:hypothetical protein
MSQTTALHSNQTNNSPQSTQLNQETQVNHENQVFDVGSQAEARPNVKKFKKRGRQREEENSGEQRVSKISTGGWIETITFMPVGQCLPQCPDCPPPSLSPPEV